MPKNDNPAPIDDAPPAAGDERWRGPTPRQIGEAVARLWDDRENDEAIARRLRIARRTLARWKERPDFAAAWHALHVNWQMELERQRRHPIARRGRPGEGGTRC